MAKGNKGGPGAGTGNASSTSGEPPPRDDGARRAVEALRDSFDGLRQDLSGLMTRLASEGIVLPIRDQLSRGLREELQAAVRDARVAGEHAVEVLGGEQRARLEVLDGLVQDVRERMVDGDVRLVALDQRASEARIDESVRAAVDATAERVFREEFQEQVERLGEAFGDADDQLAQLRVYVEQFGPGGLPVLKQQNDALQVRLDARDAEAGVLLARVAELESAAIRQRVERGIDPALVDERLRELDARDRSLADRDSLESANRRLASQVENLKEELAHWEALDLEQQQARADAKYVQRLERERGEADEARARAENARLRAEHATSSRESEAEQLRRKLREVETDRAAASQRELQLAELREERDALARQYAEEATEATRLRREQRDLLVERGRSERRVLELQEAALTAEVAWRRDYAVAQRAEQDRLRGELTEWAENLAEQQSVAIRAEVVRKGDEIALLRRRLDDQAAELDDVKRERDQQAADLRALEADLAATEAAVERHKDLLTEESVAHEARWHAQLELDANSIRAAAAVLGERDRASAVAEAEEITRQCEMLRGSVTELEDVRMRLGADIAEVGAQKGAVEGELEALRRKVDDLRERVVPDEERAGSLYRSCFPSEDLPPVEGTDEAGWLAELEKGIRGAGFVFHPRLIRAFHTSLKIAHHAPLVVLAGISGTGKSELPRLYADLGGIPFLELAVQPSWDSPHDLFGFFNYTDGRLKAEPLARLLAQIGDREGTLRQSPVMVLLDEMNLARVEYYFAELLSKLEARRGVHRFGDDAARRRASVSMDAGPSHLPVQLYLDERVLFAGTMNQDESTLTLSDKVLDRSCLLTFPAPQALEMTEQKRVTRRPRRLSWEAWAKWMVEPVGTDDQTRKLNELNDVMREMERPFGHRLFRAIHAYVANYPKTDGDRDVEHAWADQFAMKVLPRLRGLECGDRRVRPGLARLASLIPPELADAFAEASSREFFVWTGASELYRANR